jgi:hypothetical protein
MFENLPFVQREEQVVGCGKQENLASDSHHVQYRLSWKKKFEVMSARY